MIKTAGQMIAEAQEQIQCLDADQAKRLYDETNGAVIIDVRDPDAAATSKLSESINISRGLLEMKVEKSVPDPETLILTHCGGGGRASLAAFTLNQMGYSNVHAITATYEDVKKAFG